MGNGVEKHTLALKFNVELGREVISSVQILDPQMVIFFLSDREKPVSDGVLREQGVKGVFIVWNASYVIICHRQPDGSMLFDVHLANLFNVEPAREKLLELHAYYCNCCMLKNGK